MEEQAVTVQDMERNGQTLDVTVAARPLQPGELPNCAPDVLQWTTGLQISTT